MARRPPTHIDPQVEYLRRLFVGARSYRGTSQDGAAKVLMRAHGPRGPRCLRCGSTNAVELNSGRNEGKHKRQCQDCRYQYSLITGTPLEGERASYAQIVGAARLALSHSGLSLASRIAADLGLSDGSAARMALLMQELLQEAGGPDAISAAAGFGHLFKGVWTAVGAAAAACALGVLLVVGATHADAPLHAEWTSGGEVQMLTTVRKDAEPKAAWVERHTARLVGARKIWPPDSK